MSDDTTMRPITPKGLRPRPRPCPRWPIAGLIPLLVLPLAGAARAAIDPLADLDDACWEESFVDEFDTLRLEADGGPWKPGYLWPADVIINDEEQYYVDPGALRHSPFSVADGVLSIRAEPTPAAIRAHVEGQPYVSGVLTTENGFSQRHGRFEAILQPPAGRGLWSAFWLLPSFDSWPEGVAVLPEIDVMEFIGDQPRTLHTTLHTNQNGTLESHPYDHAVDAEPSAGFHRYSVVWTEQAVHWYLDRRHLVSHPTPADYTRPVHFLLNLAVGGSWPGSPDGTTPFPALYRVDSVRAFTESGRC